MGRTLGADSRSGAGMTGREGAAGMTGKGRAGMTEIWGGGGLFGVELGD